MTSFRYKALASDGSVVAGSMDASSEVAVIEWLRNQGHFPISAAPATSASWQQNIGALVRRDAGIRPRDLYLATEELAALLYAGLELDRALALVVDLAGSHTLQRSLAAVRERVKGGAHFADALSQEKLFPNFYVNMIRAGQHGGSLSNVLRRLADYLARSVAIREAITSALVYPIILLVTAFLSITVIIFFVLPEFEPLFAAEGRSLPWPTAIVIGVSDTVRSYWWLIFATGLGGVLYSKMWLKAPQNRLRLHGRLFRFPLIGKLIRDVETEKLFRTLGTLLQGGVPLPTALTLAKGVLWNQVMIEAISDSTVKLRAGGGLADKLTQTRVFNVAALNLVRIGEETGKLDEMLLRQADIDQQRIRHSIERLLAMFVPALTIILGFIIAGLIASMLVAILSVNDLALQ